MPQVHLFIIPKLVQQTRQRLIIFKRIQNFETDCISPVKTGHFQIFCKSICNQHWRFLRQHEMFCHSILFEKSFLLIQDYKGEKVWPWWSKWINSNTEMLIDNTPLNHSNTFTRANCLKIVFCINDEGIWLVVLVYR